MRISIPFSSMCSCINHLQFPVTPIERRRGRRGEEMVGGGKAHVVVIPWPAQGHVHPFMEFSHCLVHHGCRVTFLTTESALNRLVNNASRDRDDELLRLVSIPGQEYHRDKNKSGIYWPFDLHKVEEFMREEMMSTADGYGISCLVVDPCIGWGPEIAEKMGVPLAVFFPGSALWLALGLSIPNLIREGVISSDGTPVEQGRTIQLSPARATTAPVIINSNDFPWVRSEMESKKRIHFEIAVKSGEAAEKAQWLFCNSTSDFEPAAFSFIPNLLPVGPLGVTHLRHGTHSAGNFWPEDQACLEWLNQHPPGSVIYAAFGSNTVFDRAQFQELALGLQLSNRPFLWVVRPDDRGRGGPAYPEGFQEAVAAGGGRGRIVGWAPQRKVLGHPSVACFMSHCGWNSTVEGLSNGVPFLCWPYYADQFINRSYICDVWKVGLGFNPDENGVVTRAEIQNKLGKVIGEKEFRSRALNLKQKAMDSVKEGGPSYNTFNRFVHWLMKA